MDILRRRTSSLSRLRRAALLAVAAILLAPQLAAAGPVLKYLGRYESQTDGPDHLMGSAIVNPGYIAVASGTGLAIVPRTALESSTVLEPAGRFRIDRNELSNLDGAPSVAQYLPKFFQVAVRANTAYVASRYDGLWIFDLERSGDAWTVTEVGRKLRPREFTEAVQVQGNYLYLTHHADGIEVLDIVANPYDPVTVATLDGPLVDAWGIAAQANGDIWVADGAGGLKLVRLEGTTLSVIGGDTIATSPGTVLDAEVAGDHVLAAVGGRGVTVYEAATARQLGSYEVPGVCVDLARISNTQVAAACRSWVHVLEIAPGGEVTVVASARLHRRARPERLSTHLGSQVTVSRNMLYVAGWDHLDAYRFLADDADDAPDIQLASQRIHFASGTPGQPQLALIDLLNAGEGRLTISSVTCTGAGITCSIDRPSLGPGAQAVLSVRHDGTAEDVSGQVDIATNDPDDPLVPVLVFADLERNVDPLEVAPLFSGPAITRSYKDGTVTEEWLALADFAAAREPVAFVVFGSWCPACLPVAAALTHDLYARLPAGARFFLIDQGEPQKLVEHLMEKVFMPYPVLLDQDGFIGRRLYGQPKVGLPFSRAYVVDADGVVTQVSTTYDPASMLDALENALP